jgi:hypothetical protein
VKALGQSCAYNCGFRKHLWVWENHCFCLWSQDEHRRGPIIEELPDDAEHPHEHVQAQSSQEPIIEHPDDDVGPGTWLSI